MTGLGDSDNVVILLSAREADEVSRFLTRIRDSLSDRLRYNTDSEPTSDLYAIASHIYAARRERRHFFAQDLFCDPAWDMLMCLYCAEGTGEQLSITSVIYSAEVPQTTGLRWVQTLEDCGLVRRHRDKRDGRRVLVRLSDEGRKRVQLYLQRTAEKHFRPIENAA